MKGSVTSYGKTQPISDIVGDVLERYYDKASRFAWRLSARTHTTSILARVHKLLNKRPRRLIMKSTCPGCNPNYWE